MSLGTQKRGGALHFLFSQTEPSTRGQPTNHKAALKLDEARRRKKGLRHKARRERKKAKKRELARQEAEAVRCATEEATQQRRRRIEKAVAAYREDEKRRRAASVIQTAWRTPTVRMRLARAYVVRVEKARRLSRAVGVIGTAWKEYQEHKASLARVNEIMAPHRRKRQELFRAAEAAQAKDAAEAESCAAEGERTVVAKAVKTAKGQGAAPIAGNGAAAIKASEHITEKRKMISNVLREKIQTFWRRQAQEAKAAEDAKAEAAAQEAAKKADIEKRLLEKVAELLQKRQADKAAREAAERKQARLAQIRPFLQLPPSRQHAAGVPEELASHPLQLLEGQALLYSPREFDLWMLMGQVRGWSLSLGEASIWEGGVTRAAEEFAAVCGFSAAFGPLLFKHATIAVFGNTLYKGVSELPPEHIAHMFKTYWDKEVVPFDAAERFFRLVGNSRRNGIVKEDLRPFVMAIAQRHPDLDNLSPDEVSLYVETVLAVTFYKHSRCGVIRLRDLRRTGFVASINAVGRMEHDLEVSEYFSLGRHQRIREDYLSLCGGGWSVGQDDLRGYRQNGITAVGAVRASRVIDVGLRPFPRSKATGGATATSVREGYGQELEYDAWVCFFLCEEALRAGKCSEQDLRYCFDIVDETGGGKVGLTELAPFFEDMKWERISMGETEDEFPAMTAVVNDYFDAMSLERGRGFVTLADMLKPGNVEKAGRFFEELFSGTVPVPDGDQYYCDENAPGFEYGQAPPCAPPASSALYEQEAYPKASLEFERELAGICVESSDVGYSYTTAG